MVRKRSACVQYNQPVCRVHETDLSAVCTLSTRFLIAKQNKTKKKTPNISAASLSAAENGLGRRGGSSLPRILTDGTPEQIPKACQKCRRELRGKEYFCNRLSEMRTRRVRVSVDRYTVLKKISQNSKMRRKCK